MANLAKMAERVSLGSLLSLALQERSEEIAAEWLMRLSARLPERPQDIFPDRNLLNHIPEVVERISLSLSSETELEDVLSADILHELRLLTQLRRAQGYGLDELLTELEVLGEVVSRHILDVLGELPQHPSAADGMSLAARLQRVLFAMGLVAADVFLQEGNRQRLRRTEILAAFSRAVTHEVKNRSQPALLGVNLAREHLARGRTKEADEALGRVELNLQRLDAIPGDLLGLALGQERLISFPVRREPLSRVVRRAVEGLSPYAGTHGVELRCGNHMPDVRVDSGRLQLVLVNLIGNGIKHRCPDKPERWVHVRSHRPNDNGEVTLEVEDNGIGIPEEQLLRIFDDRLRGHASSLYDGEGLGLALAHEALLQAGSRLRVESQVGRGTIFTFRVPLELEKR